MAVGRTLKCQAKLDRSGANSVEPGPDNAYEFQACCSPPNLFRANRQWQCVLQVKPAPSHIPANAHTSPAMPTPKPSYSQVTRLGIRACDPEKQHVTEAHDRPCDLRVLWGSHDQRARDPGKKTGDLPRDWSATRSGDYRYVTRPLNHPVGTTNGGVRTNKVVRLRIIGAQPQQPQQTGHPQLVAPQRGKGATRVPYVNLP